MLLLKVLIVSVFVSLGLSCLVRSYAFVFSTPAEIIPGPLILTVHIESSWWVGLWAIAWGVTGLLLLIGPALGAKVKIIKTAIGTTLRLDDLGMVLFSALNVTWGVSYLMEWIGLTLRDIPNTNYVSAGTFSSIGIFTFAIWSIYFATRETRGDLMKGTLAL